MDDAGKFPGYAVSVILSLCCILNYRTSPCELLHLYLTPRPFLLVSSTLRGTYSTDDGYTRISLRQDFIGTAFCLRKPIVCYRSSGLTSLISPELPNFLNSRLRHTVSLRSPSSNKSTVSRVVGRGKILDSRPSIHCFNSARPLPR